MFFNIPLYVKDIMAYLEGNGFEVFAVGGCVRDSLLGKKPFDWDLCTNATPDEMIKTLDKRFLVIPTGIKHGTVTVIVDGKHIEITTYRTDGAYTDSRHPVDVEFVKSLEEDLKRRDFTINAMAYNIKSGIVDIFGGAHDLNNMVIKCVGNPTERFTEDALRIMRCIRFAAVFGFNVEAETEKALFSLKDKLDDISKERIFEELKKILVSKAPFYILSRYNDVISRAISADLDADKYEIINIVPNKISLRLAAILCQFDAETASDILRGLKSDTQTRKDVCTMLLNKEKPIISCKYDAKWLLRDYGAKLAKDITWFSGAYAHCDALDIEKAISYINDVLEQGECYQLSQLKINGNDLVERGYSGRDINIRLNEILNDVIDGKIENKRDKLLNIV